MESSLTAETITLTATLEELDRWQHCGFLIYAIPKRHDALYVAEIYIERLPQWRDDFILATVKDFLDVEGWSILELDEEDPAALDTITLTIPRRRRPPLVRP